MLLHAQSYVLEVVRMCPSAVAWRLARPTLLNLQCHHKDSCPGRWQIVTLCFKLMIFLTITKVYIVFCAIAEVTDFFLLIFYSSETLAPYLVPQNYSSLQNVTKCLLDHQTDCP